MVFSGGSLGAGAFGGGAGGPVGGPQRSGGPFGANSAAESAFTEAPRVTAWNTIASYATYFEAQQAVDHLVAVGFPVEHVEIVGSELRSVEQVTGPMTAGRAAAAGAGAGAWIGLFIGLLVGLFTVGPTWLGLVLGGLLIGAAWGAALGLVARWLQHQRHNFSSLRAVVATRYDLIGLDGTASQARAALGITAPPAP